MSFISNLTLALSAYSGKDVFAASVSKDHPEYYHVYYRQDGKNRVMLVPKKVVSVEQLQSEVSILLSRNAEEQNRLGYLDAR